MSGNKEKEKKGQILIEKMERIPEQELVELLWSGDNEAWEYLFFRGIIPVLKQPTIAAIMRDRKFQREEILAMIYETLIYKKKLALFEFRCPLYFYVRNYTRGIILNFCKKNDLPLSDPPPDIFIDNKSLSTRNKQAEWNVGKECFIRLWKSNPRRGYVHMLKICHRMTSREIMSLLNISSESNVDKIFQRALKDMREFKEDLI